MLFQGKNILVTGATGLIGYNLVCRLLKEGVSTLYATGRSLKKLEATFEDYSGNKVLKLIAHDAATALPADIKVVDYIFHAAGPMERDIVLNRPVDVILPNIQGVINCLEFLKEQATQTGRKGRLVAFSSVTVYDNPTQEDYVATEDVTNYATSLDAPTACYSESKRMTEVIVKAYTKQYGVDAVVARFSTVYGPTKNIPNTAFYEIIRKAIRGEDVVLNGNKFPRRDNIYIDDAISGLIALALLGAQGESYNISSNGEGGNFASIAEIAKQVATLINTNSNMEVMRVHLPNCEKEIDGGLRLCNEKLKGLGWRITVSHIDGLINTINTLSKQL